MFSIYSAHSFITGIFYEDMNDLANETTNKKIERNSNS